LNYQISENISLNMNEPLKILFVEDYISDAELIWREIEKNQIAIIKLLVDNKKEFIDGLETFRPDIIISDYMLPQFDGMSALRIRNELTPMIPFILVTGSINEEVAVECMKAGADDYILKENLSRLGPAVVNSIHKIELLKQKMNAENALRESEERYRILYNDAVVGLYRTNLQGEILIANKTLIRMLGFQTFEELASKNLNGSGYGPSYQRFQFIDQIERDGEVRDLEAIWTCKDGKEIYVKESAKPIRDYEGKIIYYDGIVEDITKRKKAEEDLGESQKLIEGILNAIPVRVFWKDINLVYLGCNTIFAQDAGFDEPKDIIGKNDYQLVWRDQADLYRTDDWEVIKAGNPKFHIEETQTTPEGKTITLLTSKVPLFHSNGEIIGILGNYIDITERKQAEAEIISERSLLRTLIDNLPALIYVKDTYGRKVIANKADFEYVGYENEASVIGKTDVDLFLGKIGSYSFTDDKKVISSGEALLNHEEYFIDKNGVKRWLSSSKIPLFDKVGKVTGLVGIAHDITEIKSNEVELILAKEKAEESDRLKTAFLNNISHEIRTPLNAIVGFAALLGSSELTLDKKKEFVDMIYTSNDQLLSIISGIISLASLEAGQVQIYEVETDLNKLLLNVYEQFLAIQNSTEVSFNYHLGLPDNQSLVLSDPVKLTQILVNLVGNALKFTHKGKVSFGYTITGQKLQFFVEDTGIGIPEEMNEIIFERFMQVDNSPTRKYGGTGLGLSLSKGYVELLGGKIMLTSEPGKGSVFSFTLPYKPVTPAATDNISDYIDSEALITPGKTILVAEDEINNFLLINEILTDLQLKVIRAGNGLEAVNFCSSGNLPDLVLMDIKMPVMDGIEAIKKIKKLNPRLPVIALTAYALEADKKNILLSGCDAYILKPINRQLLLKNLAKYLGK